MGWNVVERGGTMVERGGTMVELGGTMVKQKWDHGKAKVGPWSGHPGLTSEPSHLSYAVPSYPGIFGEQYNKSVHKVPGT